MQLKEENLTNRWHVKNFSPPLSFDFLSYRMVTSMPFSQGCCGIFIVDVRCVLAAAYLLPSKTRNEVDEFPTSGKFLTVSQTLFKLPKANMVEDWNLYQTLLPLTINLRNQIIIDWVHLLFDLNQFPAQSIKQGRRSWVSICKEWTSMAWVPSLPFFI